MEKAARLAVLMGTLIWLCLIPLAGVGLSALHIFALFLLSEVLFYGGALALGGQKLRRLPVRIEASNPHPR